MVLMRALRDMNLPKFVFEDVPLFLGLISDLFPGLDCPRVRYPSLNDAVEEVVKELGYLVIPDQTDKVIQLYETMLTRHTTMLVGPSGGGKSVVIDVLSKAQSKLGLPTKLYILNAKSVTVNELYGVLDPVSRDWTDGLLSNIFREINKPTDKKERKYIVFDGDVDAVWVENMNSVMDDNKLLTLPNGERIRLQKHVAMLFEVGDLQYASPATVSRCGMVYLDPKNLGYIPYFERWLAGRQNRADADVIAKLATKYIAPLLDYVLEGILGTAVEAPLRQIIPATNLNMITQLCTLLQILLPDQKTSLPEPVVEAQFIFCLVWSLGAALIESDRLRFSEAVKKLSGLPFSSGTEGITADQLPKSDTLFDFFFDMTAFEWNTWVKYVPKYEHDRSQPFYQILVPTADTVRHSWLLEKLASNKKPVLFVGNPGTSKTVTIQKYIRELPSDRYLPLTMNFSSRTSSLDVQRTLEANVEKRTKDSYGPASGKRLVVLIDDLNMPSKDKYGTMQPIALLKLLMERGGFYDRGKELNWKYMKDIQFITAMGAPGGGRQEIDPRFSSLFSVFNIQFPNQESLEKIYSSIINGHVAVFNEDCRYTATKITAATLKVYNEVLQKLPPTPSKFHYIFNLRDISRIYEGLLLSVPERYNSSQQLVRLWRNECLRVFHDRLISDEDKQIVQETIKSIVTHSFNLDADHVLKNPILFGDFRQALHEENVRLYEDLLDFNAVRSIVNEIMEALNIKTGASKQVLFEDALDHMVKAHRIIRMRKGHALLVGVGGSGKQSIARLAAFAAGCSVFEITLSRGYGEADFREDLKTLYSMVGVQNQKTVFLFTDAHVVQEGFLELINSMLTTGVVPALYSDEERDAALNSIRDAAEKAGFGVTKENLWQFFVDRCTKNLHVVLCMSPTGDKLRTRCRNFPGLVNNTVIDWYSPWPEQALQSVADAYLIDEAIPVEKRPSIINHMVNVHLSVSEASVAFQQRWRRQNYVTPKNYLDYINTYLRLLKEKRQQNGILCERLESGLRKLHESSKQLDELNAQLAVQNVAVKQKTEACNKLLEVIASSTAQAEEKKELAQKKEKELEVQNQQIARDKADAEIALAEALPALEEARKALSQLSASEITEIRSFAKPPKEVQKICECLCVLKNIKDLSWKSAKAMMSANDFKSSLMTMDVDAITGKYVY
jgi:dynein heavy chain